MKFPNEWRFCQRARGARATLLEKQKVESRNGRAVKRVKPEVGTGSVRVVGNLGKSRNWECRKQKWGSRHQAGNDLSAVSPVDAEIRIGGDDHRIGQGFAHAHQAGVGQAHGYAGVPGAQVEHLA